MCQSFSWHYQVLWARCTEHSEGQEHPSPAPNPWTLRTREVLESQQEGHLPPLPGWVQGGFLEKACLS